MRSLLVFGIVALFSTHCGKNSNESRQPDDSRPPSFSLTVDSSNELPVCGQHNSRQLIFLVSDQKFMHCQNDQWLPIELKAPRGEVGPAGERGPQGPQGESREATAVGGFGLFDASGRLVGYPDSPTISPEADRYVMFVDGLVGQIRPSSGQVLLGDSSCYYETTDCSKICYSVNGPADPLGNHLLERVSDKRLLFVPTDAKNEGDLLYRSRWSGGECEVTQGFSPKRFATTEWQPMGLTVPLQLPLRVRLLK